MDGKLWLVLGAIAAGFLLGACERRQATPPLPVAVSPIGIEMVRVPAGSFVMGSPQSEPGRDFDEGPTHTVTISRPFYLAAKEVTQAQWQAVMDANPATLQSCGPTCPVETVSWYDAVEFCNRLSKKEGRTPCYRREKKSARSMDGSPFSMVDKPLKMKGAENIHKLAKAPTAPVGVSNNDSAGTSGLSPGIARFRRPPANEARDGFVSNLNTLWLRDCTGYRLPTEAEWEYAARAGAVTALPSGPLEETECGKDKRLARLGWYCGNAAVSYPGCLSAADGGGASCSGTHPGGEKQANAWGLFDMHGNVLEWVWDRFGPYPGAAVTDPQGPPTGEQRVQHGGGWRSLAKHCRAANRRSNVPEYKMSVIGFRVARNAD